MKRKSASRNRLLSRTVNRGTLNGRPRGGDRRSRSGSVAALLGRLRRLELVTLVTYGKLERDAKALDRILSDMLELNSIVEPRAGSSDQRNEVSVPHEGPAEREDSREAGADSRPEGLQDEYVSPRDAYKKAREAQQGD